METAFLVFALGFFLLVIFLVTRDDEARWHRKINEAREFGLHDREYLHRNQRKK